MHRDIGATIAHRLFELLDEEPFAANRRERLVENAIALRGQSEKLDGAARIPCAETFRDMFCLPQRQRGLTGGNDELGGGRHRRDRHRWKPNKSGYG